MALGASKLFDVCKVVMQDIITILSLGSGLGLGAASWEWLKHIKRAAC